MRRAVSVLSIGALVGALCSAVVPAFAYASLDAPTVSLSTELFNRCFSEPNTSSESPLGAFAFNVPPTIVIAAQPNVLTMPGISLSRLASLITTVPAPTAPGIATPAYPAPAVHLGGEPTITLTSPQLASPQPAIGYYQDAAPAPTVAPKSVRFDLPNGDQSRSLSFSPVLSSSSGFNAPPIGAGSQASVPQTNADVSVPMRLGHVHLETHADAGEARSDALAFKDTAYGGGATFDARIGKQKLGVDLSGHSEHLTVNQPVFDGASLDGQSNFELTNNLPVFVPAYADINKQTLSAGLAVPVNRRLTASVQVDAQHLVGGYGVQGLTNLDANNMIYGARLTYQLKGTSAISLSANQFHYQDNLIPLNTFNQTSANLNFTVKF
ncbi:MAG: hypothetical protein JO322_04675 [Candidatus Eremiobacteraeota bacterium]|nr:hypothetical protein [Candidatus Eremiobacteraeota bacterium]